MTQKKEAVILGVDPGLSITGFGIVVSSSRGVSLREYGSFKTAAQDPLQERIAAFFEFISKKVEQWEVTHLALETPFLGKNAQNFLKLGYLRGALYLIAHKHELIISEFSPTEIKKQITGFGGAQKEQVARVVHRFIPGLAPSIPYNDITDAIAIALCGLWQQQSRLTGFMKNINDY